MYSPSRFVRLTAIVCLLCLPALTWASEPNPAPLTPQQSIDSRKMVIYNGTSTEVHYDTNGLPPDRVAQYQALEHYENTMAMAEETQRLNATYLRDAQTLEANQMASQAWNLNGGVIASQAAPPSYAALPASTQPTTSDCAAPAAADPSVAPAPDETMDVIARLQSAHEAVLAAEQNAAAKLSDAPARPLVPSVAPANPPAPYVASALVDGAAKPATSDAYWSRVIMAFAFAASMGLLVGTLTKKSL